MRLNPMRIISASVNAEIIYLFLMYDSCEPRMTCPPSLEASVSDCGTAGLGAIPGCPCEKLFHIIPNNWYVLECSRKSQSSSNCA